ncbi:hypothetical protein MRX96_023005 [Rhipicephalus microplus]
MAVKALGVLDTVGKRPGWQSLSQRWFQVRRVRADDDTGMLVYLQNDGKEQSSWAEGEVQQVQARRLIIEQPARHSVRVTDAVLPQIPATMSGPSRSMPRIQRRS